MYPEQKNKSSPHTKINKVRRIMVYNAHIKFELNQKHCLDTSIHHIT